MPYLPYVLRVVLLTALTTVLLFASTSSKELDLLQNPPQATSTTHWSDKLAIRGYTQLRHTTMTQGVGQNYSLWSDKSVGDDANFLIRRARIILYGRVGDHLRIYAQPDFASSAGGKGNIAQVRDFYGDVYIDKTKIHRIRLGQSKVPFGFENMQSSSKRLTPDRNDPLNSAARDERDIGAFYYYTPVHVQELFKEIDAKGLKSSGNYGMFALGVYNGQGANRAEQNENLHIVTRLTYPFKIKSGQIFEFAIQAYKGKFFVANTESYSLDGNSSIPAPTQNTLGTDDMRAAVTAIMYPQPFGFQTEYNAGYTPGLDMSDNTIKRQFLHGGYFQTMYRMTNVLKKGDSLTPFVKWQYFDGYSKAEPNAPRNEVNDLEIGAEWYVAPELRIQLEYHFMHRNNLVSASKQTTATSYERFKAQAIRIQAQMNF